ncbi:MAG: sigma-70 family RNA polymerase sigma factor [Dehalococcoidia bacterium]|nr:sigma-70 family RNA polymerase sigma factor [Dehalococcoidia bacterium]
MEQELRTGPGTESVDDERAVIDAATAGGVEAFATLYDWYMERVYNYVHYRVGNRQDAEDLTQQVFLNAWHAISRYRQTGATFVAWLFTIAHNQLVSFRRGAKPVSYLEEEPPTQARWADPEAEAVSNHDQAAVRRAILRLKPDQQQVITMRFLEDLEFADIAAALGKKEGNIRVIQHRAMVELQRLLEHEVVV